MAPVNVSRHAESASAGAGWSTGLPGAVNKMLVLMWCSMYLQRNVTAAMDPPIRACMTLHVGLQCRPRESLCKKACAYLNTQAKVPVLGPGLLTVTGTEGLVGHLVVGLPDGQVLPIVAAAQGVEGHRAVAVTAADDCTVAAAAAHTAHDTKSVCADVVKALEGVADVAGEHAQLWLPQRIHLCMPQQLRQDSRQVQLTVQTRLLHANSA